jgi:dynein heavy chain, axonemal
MIVGPTFGGKTTCHRILGSAITQLAKETEGRAELPVKATIINPKSVTIDQLYGFFDKVSQDFTDGILGRHFKTAAYVEAG